LRTFLPKLANRLDGDGTFYRRQHVGLWSVLAKALGVLDMPSFSYQPAIACSPPDSD
jgi:hypothetical protein